jgi:hypothetical protein
MIDSISSRKEAMFYKNEKGENEWLPSKFGRNISDPFNSFEVRILGPYGCLVYAAGCKNNTVCHRHVRLKADLTNLAIN